MSTTAFTPHNRMHSPREQYLDVYEQEHEKTMRVLRAYPRDKSELQPHPKCKTARGLAWQFVVEQGAMEKGLTTGFDFSKPPSFPPVPESFDEILAAFEAGHKKVTGLIGGLRDDEMYATIQFFTGPGKIGDMTRMQFLWLMLHDQIHHRGQFSIYLRMADGKVPAIYGPSLDEPWM
ncbi:MAG: DinB family protein [Thermoanaerobaculia bacterium]